MDISNKLFLHRLINGIADSIIKVFIPLLIFKQTNSLIMCFSFSAITYFFTALFFIILKNFLKNHSATSIILHIFPLIIECFLLLINLNWGLIITLAILDALSVCLYYGAINNIFVGTDSNKNVAKFEAGALIGKIFFTILSAYLLGNMTNSLIFIISTSVILYILSLIPIFKSSKQLKALKNDVSDMNILQVHNKCFKFNIYHAFTGILSFVTEIIIPLYLYSTGLSLTVVGIIIALGMVLQILASYFSNYLDSKHFTNISLIINSIIISISILTIFLIKNPYIIYILTIVINFCYKVIYTVMFNKFSIFIKKFNIFINALIIRDVYQNFARCINSFTFLLFQNFPTAFILGILSGALMGVTGKNCLNDINKNVSNDINKSVNNDINTNSDSDTNSNITTNEKANEN